MMSWKYITGSAWRLHGHRGDLAKYSRSHCLQHRHIYWLHGNRQYLGVCYLHDRRKPSFPSHHDHDFQVLFHVPGQQIRGNGHARFKNHSIRTYRGSSTPFDEQTKFRGLQKLYNFRHAFIATFKFKMDPILMIIAAGVAGFLLY